MKGVGEKTGRGEETQTIKSNHIHSQAAVPHETSQLQKPGDPTTELQTDDKLENASFLDRLFQCSVQGIQRSHDNSPDVRDTGTQHLKGQRIHSLLSHRMSYLAPISFSSKGRYVQKVVVNLKYQFMV